MLILNATNTSEVRRRKDLISLFVFEIKMYFLFLASIFCDIRILWETSEYVYFRNEIKFYAVNMSLFKIIICSNCSYIIYKHKWVWRISKLKCLELYVLNLNKTRRSRWCAENHRGRMFKCQKTKFRGGHLGFLQAFLNQF